MIFRSLPHFAPIRHHLQTSVRAFCLGLLLTLSGCSLLQKEDPLLPRPSPNSDLPPITQFDEKAAIHCWVIEGKVGTITYDPSLPKGGSANLKWEQQHEQFNLQLSGPLGQGKVTLTGNPSSLTIDNGKQPIHSDDPEQLLEDALGWFIPMSSLTWWVRGLPAPSHAKDLSEKDSFSYHLNDEGHLLQLHQQEWAIRYRTMVEVEGLTLPRKIDAVHERLKVKLSLNRWGLGGC